MTAIIPAAAFQPDLSESDQLKVARSDFIDAYNAADASVRDLLKTLKRAPSQNLSPNIDLVLAIEPTAQYPAKTKARVDRSLAHLKTLASVRSDLVHGIMVVLHVEGRDQAMFQNIQKRPPAGRAGLLVSAEELEAATRSLTVITRSVTDRTRNALSQTGESEPSPAT